MTKKIKYIYDKDWNKNRKKKLENMISSETKNVIENWKLENDTSGVGPHAWGL